MFGCLNNLFSSCWIKYYLECEVGYYVKNCSSRSAVITRHGSFVFFVFYSVSCKCEISQMQRDRNKSSNKPRPSISVITVTLLCVLLQFFSIIPSDVLHYSRVCDSSPSTNDVPSHWCSRCVTTVQKSLAFLEDVYFPEMV